MSSETLENVYVLTPMQQGLLFHSLEAPGEGLYVDQMALNLVGEVDRGALARAFAHVVERHQALRTSFHWKDLDKPLQAVHRKVAEAFFEEDWRSEAPEGLEARFADFLAADRARGFDLDRPPLLRLTLVRVSDTESRLVWTYHHIVLDGWSGMVLMGEVMAAYSAFYAGTAPALRPARPYGDYIAWLRRRDPEAAARFWGRRLAGFTEATPLTLERSVPAAEEGTATARVAVSPQRADELRVWARRQQLTLNTLVVGAWGLLLSRTSGRNDVVFGATVSGRPAEIEGVEGMVGLFINTVPVRVTIPPEVRLVPWLKELQAQQLAAHAFEHTPLGEIQRLSDLPSGAPLFHSILAFENLPAHGRTARDEELDPGQLYLTGSRYLTRTNYPLTLRAIPGERLLLEIDHEPRSFDRTAVLRLALHLENLLLTFAASGDGPLAEISPLLPAERQQLTLEWNDTAGGYPREEAVEALFARQAAATPHAVALTSPGLELTYAELESRAETVAQHLRSLGVGPESRVGLAFERQPGLVAGMLGILKAGGAYVPLDFDYPPERLAFMIDDSRLSALVTGADGVATLPPAASALSTLVLSADGTLLSAPAGASAPATGAVPPTADRLAYVMYTSGSTGRPKGVEIPHRGIVRLVFSPNFMHLGADTRFLHIAPISFDASTIEVWGPLLHGGRVHLPAGRALSLDELADAIEASGGATLFLTTALFNQLVDEKLDRISSARQILTGGDAVSLPRFARAMDLLPETTVVNGYGPTENTTFSTCSSYRAPRRGKAAFEGTVPIGRPLPGSEAFVADLELRLAPAGVPGEVVLGGDGLARGYQDRPELTAERFVPNPWGAPGSRLYRTGDRARLNSWGELEFVGRLDNQVKVRGFRVEPGEIEAALARHPQVREAVVVVTEDAVGKALAACVVPVAGVALDALGLRDFLIHHLPAHMIPARFLFLDELPLTPVGKADRRALTRKAAKSEGGGTADGPADFVPPQGAVEELLAGQWASVLNVSRVGRHDDFLALGGHSLLATLLLSRVREAFEVELPLAALFEAPTLAEQAERIEAALRAGGAGEAEDHPIRPMPRDRPLPLSYSQQRLWVLDQFDPGVPAYNVPLPLRLTGAVSRPALEHALTEVVRRHEVLRTRFEKQGDEPFQLIDPPAPIRVPEVDLSGLAEVARKAELGRRVEEETLRRFDLARGPVLRATLVRIAPDDHAFLLTLHHIASDGWSMNILVEEVTTFYREAMGGPPAGLPPLPVQYADFAVWQREWLAGPRLEQQMAFWRQRLAAAPSRLDLPLDRPRQNRTGLPGGRFTFALPGGLGDGLRRLARAERATSFMVLLAAWGELLSRLSSQDDILLGTPVANRHRREIEGLIGFFVNTLVLRADLSGRPTVRKLIARAREQTLSAHRHQDAPFEKLVEELRPDRSFAANPFFQVLFSVEHPPREGEMGEVGLSTLPLERLEAKTDLSLAMVDFETGYSGALEFALDLFDESTARRWIRHFEVLLQGFVAKPEAAATALSLLTEAESRQLLEDWNQTAVAYPREATLQTLFANQVEIRPETVALAWDGPERKQTTLTYAELDQASQFLADHLQAQGVGPETPVGLWVERSPEYVIGMLAIAKAQGTFVPLDPSYPVERLAHIVADTDLSLVVAGNATPDLTPLKGGRGPLTLLKTTERPGFSLAGGAKASALTDSHLTAPATRPLSASGEGEPPAAGLSRGRAGGNNLAYVLYTSGSTGTPKGVEIPHRGLIRLLFPGEGGYAHFGPEEVFLQLASPTFDPSLLEIWGALVHGATLVIPPEGIFTADEIGRILERHQVTTLWLTSGLFHHVANERPEIFAPLRQLLAGGDVLSPHSTRRALAAMREGAVLVDGYGPTENSVFTTCHRMLVAEDVGDPVPIGRPIGNTTVYLLDREMAPAPVGVPAELYTGGDGLARGYLKRPDTTAAGFVPNPFGAPGSRLYRTGDRARYLPDGRIEFLGRTDAQVKVRGFRIELGEIEAALGRHPRVRDAAVVVKAAEGAGVPKVAAFVVPAEDAFPSPAELVDFLAQSLPPAMVPSVFTFLDTLPVTAVGKPDRRALAALPLEEAAEVERTFVAPRTAIEERLAEIWAQVLKLPEVSVEDGFLELGGHSLLATSLISRVRDAFAIELPLATLFDAPTVAGQARKVEEALAAAGRGEIAPPIRPADRTRPLPLSFAQQRLWILDRFDPGMPVYNVPLALTAEGDFSLPAFRHALSAVVARHEVLRTHFAGSADDPHQEIAPTPTADHPFPVPEIDLAGLSAENALAEATRLAAAEALHRFRLAQGPLLRALFLRLPERRQALLLTAHHVVFDAWSAPILFRELSALYDGAVAGMPVALPALPVQYADFAVWQRNWLSGPVLEAQMAFWRGQLAGAPAGLDLPTDRPRPPVQTFPGTVVGADFGPAPAASVRALATEAKGTPFMVLLAALKELLRRYSGKTDVSVGAPIAGRNRSETEGLIGFFVNFLVLRTDLSGSPTARELVERVRRVTLDAFAHQDMPFEKLVEELHPERSLALTPFFQVVFNYLEPQAGPAFTGVELGGLPSSGGGTAAKFDLTFSLGGEGRLGGTLEHNTDLYDRATARRMLEHAGNLLAGFAAHPELPAAALPLLAPAERHQLLEEWNDNLLLSEGGEDDVPIHRLFELQAARTPEAVALRYRDEEITYRQLEVASGRLARRLAALGIGPEVPVAIFLERTPAIVAALLAVLRAGGFYVPLDPTYPRERLQFTLEDSKAPVILTHEWLEDILPVPSPSASGSGQSFDLGNVRSAESPSPVAGERTGERATARLETTLPSQALRLHLDPKIENWEEPSAGESAEPLPVTSANLAYLIYTSGSTGRPKGIAIAHKNTVAMLRWAHEMYPEEDRAGLVASTSVCFDISVFQIFLPLSFGGTILLLGNALDLRGDPYPGLARLVDTVPSAAAELLRIDAIPRSTRTLNLAGEAIPVPLVLEIARKIPHVERVFNLYGPSECTTYSMIAPVSPAHLPPPIGRPIAGTGIFVLDPEMKPVPIGVPGQVFLAGAGLSRGYLDRPDQTAAGFLPHPLSEEPGARIYRSGDLARILHDGTLEFLGRIDHQVKVRGFRIELGEVEAALARHPAVAKAAVAVREDTPGDRRLVGYVVARPDAPAEPAIGEGTGLSAAELRSFLKQTLPEFMVPSAFAVLTKMPLNSSGKVDRLALPAPEGSGKSEGGGGEYVEPRSDLEVTLAGVICEVLGRERVGRNDNFFDLGGHSLLMIRAASALEERLGRKIEVLELFQYPSIALLAQYLEGEAAALPSQEELTQKSEERRQGRSRRRELRKRSL